MKRVALSVLCLALVAGCGTGVHLVQRETSMQAASRAVAAPPIAAEILSPNEDDRPTPEISAIILHHTAMASDANATACFFQDPKSKVSAHYVVDRSGAIVRCVPDNLRAWHAGVSEFLGQGDVNNFSIGIEICNVGDNVDPYPPAQIQAVVHLVAWLSATYHVPLTNLTRHRDIALPAGRKHDTSDNFDEEYVRKAAQALLSGKAMAAYHPNVPPAGYDRTRQFHVVQPGETFASISDDTYDTPALAGAIRRLNPGKALVPGTTLQLPTSY